jgi:hypothetical protein
LTAVDRTVETAWSLLRPIPRSWATTPATMGVAIDVP